MRQESCGLSHPASCPCYTQTRIPRKGPPARIPEDSWVLVTPCSSCYRGARSLHTGSPHVEQGCRVSRLSATIRVSRDRRAPWVLRAVRNLLSFEAGLHPGDTSTAWTPGPRGASANTQPPAGPAPTSQQALSFPSDGAPRASRRHSRARLRSAPDGP